MALFRGIQEYIALDANNITLVLLLSSLAIYSCIPLKAIQYYIIVYKAIYVHAYLHLMTDRKWIVIGGDFCCLLTFKYNPDKELRD